MAKPRSTGSEATAGVPSSDAAGAAAPASSASRSLLPHAAHTGSNSCRTTPKANSVSIWPPRALTTTPTLSVHSAFAASSRRVLPIPAAPTTASSPPLPPLAAANAAAIRPSSWSRSKSPLPADAPGLLHPASPTASCDSRWPPAAFTVASRRSSAIRTPSPSNLAMSLRLTAPRTCPPNRASATWNSPAVPYGRRSVALRNATRRPAAARRLYAQRCARVPARTSRPVLSAVAWLPLGV